MKKLTKREETEELRKELLSTQDELEQVRGELEQVRGELEDVYATLDEVRGEKGVPATKFKLGEIVAYVDSHDHTLRIFRVNTILLHDNGPMYSDGCHPHVLEKHLVTLREIPGWAEKQKEQLTK